MQRKMVPTFAAALVLALPAASAFPLEILGGNLLRRDASSPTVWDNITAIITANTSDAVYDQYDQVFDQVLQGLYADAADGLANNVTSFNASSMSSSLSKRQEHPRLQRRAAVLAHFRRDMTNSSSSNSSMSLSELAQILELEAAYDLLNDDGFLELMDLRASVVDTSNSSTSNSTGNWSISSDSPTTTVIDNVDLDNDGQADDTLIYVDNSGGAYGY